MTTVLGSTHVVEQLSFSMLPSNLSLILTQFIMVKNLDREQFWGKQIFGSQKIKNGPKIKSKLNVKIEGNIENESCSTT